MLKAHCDGCKKELFSKSSLTEAIIAYQDSNPLYCETCSKQGHCLDLWYEERRKELKEELRDQLEKEKEIKRRELFS